MQIEAASQPEKQVLSLLDSSPSGLTSVEAHLRLKKYGANIFKSTKRSWPIELLENFKSPLVIILLIVSAISFSLGEKFNASIVFSMVFLSVGLNFILEHRANRAAEKLKSHVSPKSTVLRDGELKEIATSQVVIGDIVDLNAGDLIPADLRLIESKDLFLNQSALTGESFPVEKNHLPLSKSNLDLPDLTNIAFLGTSVVTGTARGVVIRVGKETEFGKIVGKLGIDRDANEFTKGISSFSLLVTRVVIVFVIFIFLFNFFFKHDFLQSLTFAIAVAVGLTPEFLPMVMAVTMSRGSIKMSQKGVIVKRLTAIPSFGSMDVLCTDKTGTLTQDHIRLVKYLDISGQESEAVFHHAYLNSFFQTGVTNPLDKAVTDFRHESIAKVSKIDEIPFDFNRKRLSIAVSAHGTHHLITKGAPEEVLSICNFVDDSQKTKKLTPTLRRRALSLYEKLSSEGFRVLAVATKKEALSKTVFTVHDEASMVFVGLIAFLDPPRPSVRSSIDRLESLGIEVKVITGDNELVTQKVCSSADIDIKGIVLGHEIDNLDDQNFYQKASRSTIFARFSPSQKQRLISLLKKNGHVVGFMGDGINDVPSLQAADVGISVANGVDVAKETADIILTHKNLHELSEGVVEGRVTFGNTNKYIMMGLSSNFGNMFSVLGAVLFLPFLPMLPIQILLNNFLYDLSQITLPFDKVDAEYTQRPKRWDMGQIKKFMLIFGPVSSLFDFIAFFVLYSLYSHFPAGFQTGWFMESLATQTLAIHVIRTRKLPFIQSRASPLLYLSTFSIVIISWLIPNLSLGGIFGFIPLSAQLMFVLIAILLVYLLTLELAKRLFYNSYHQI